MRKGLLKAALALACGSYAPLCRAQEAAKGPQPERTQAAVELTQEDRATLVKLALERALVDREIPEFDVMSKYDSFLLSTENIDAESVPTLENVKLRVLEPEKIKEIAEARGSYVYYLLFRKFKSVGDQVVVELDCVPMYSSKDKVTGFGGGLSINYVKQDGKWVEKEFSRGIA